MFWSRNNELEICADFRDAESKLDEINFGGRDDEEMLLWKQIPQRWQ